MYKLSQHEEQKNAYVLTSNDYTYVEQLLRRREHCGSRIAETNEYRQDITI